MEHLKIIEESFSEKILPCKNSDSAFEWARLGFYICFHSLKKIRAKRLKISNFEKQIKSDGSPATDFEKEIELFSKEALYQFSREASFVGEELGHIGKENKILFAIDPIDGTRSFLSGFDTYSITLSFIRGKEPLFSLIGAPSTGDIAYRIGGESSKIFQFNFFNNEIDLIDLPLFLKKKSKPILVNIHPSVDSVKYMEKLYKLWKNKKISLVKSVSGSPALQILESSKGSTIYVNGWSTGETQPFDLVSAIHILRGCGGFARNSKGQDIDPWSHKGLYMTGLNRDDISFLLKEFQNI